MKKTLSLIAALCSVILSFSIINLARPIRIPVNPDGVFDESRILITYRTGVTGLGSKVLEGKDVFQGVEYNQYDEILLQGNTPHKSIFSESLYGCDFICNGTGSTLKKGRQGVIPIFTVVKWQPTGYIPNIWNDNRVELIISLAAIALSIVGLLIIGIWVLTLRLKDRYSR